MDIRHQHSAALYLALVACSSSSPPPEPRPIPAPKPSQLDPHQSLAVESLGAPVRASRTWASALAPNRRGGWNFITQSFELYTSAPTEFVVVDLERGTASIREGTPQRYTNANFKAGSELRAPNGRVFLPGVENSVAYYDPTDETVKELGSLLPPGDDKVFYQGVIGPDGIVYLGTQSNKLPTIVRLDPATLKARTIGKVGRDRKTYSYAYEMAVDPPWIYVTVGQNPWELAAIHIATGESRILATRDERAFMSLETKADGIVATLITNLGQPNESRQTVWCTNGAISKTQPRKRVKQPAKKVPTAPEVDLSAANPDSNGIGRIRWRPRGSTEQFREVQFKVEHVTPVALESLLALPDGSVLGNARQYHGFFRYTPKTSKFELYGAHGPSGGARAVLDGIAYITGYPKALLYAYDPTKAWTSTVASENAALRDEPIPDVNPRRLGNFRDSGAHYAAFLVPSRERLFFAGRRERDGDGGGVGYYEPTRRMFSGHFKDLATLDPAGLVVLDDLVVYAGKSRERGRDAQLVIYDRELHELARVAPRASLTSAGLIYVTPTPGVIVGISERDKVLYRYDVRAHKLLTSVTLDGQIGASTRRASDGTIWIVIDNTLARIDSKSLLLTRFGEPGSIPEGAANLTWQGDDLYMTVGPELRRVVRVGLPPIRP